MRSLRQRIHGNLAAAWALLALSLAMKFVVPIGYMPMFSAAGIEIVICTGMGPATATMAMPGMDHGKKGGDHAPAKPDAPCAFAGLSAPSLGGADIVQLAVALAAIVAACILAVAVLRIARQAFLRPPLRGPPLTH